MLKTEIFQRMEIIFRETFNDEELILKEEFNSEDILDWDSLGHLNLMVNLEQEFSCNFSIDEFSNLKNVGELLELIFQKIN